MNHGSESLALRHRAHASGDLQARGPGWDSDPRLGYPTPSRGRGGMLAGRWDAAARRADEDRPRAPPPPRRELGNLKEPPTWPRAAAGSARVAAVPATGTLSVTCHWQ